MTNRVVFLILGMVIIGIGLAGFYYFQQYQEREAEIRELEVVAEKERQRARAAEEARREQEQRKLAEERRREAESQKAKAINERRRLEEERRIAQEKQKREQELEEERRRQAALLKKQQEAEQARKRKIQDRADKTTNISFSMDLNNSKEIGVAWVYEGDKIKINIKRIDGANQKLFVGLVPMRAYQHIQAENSKTTRRLTSRYFAKGPYGAPTLVTMPLNDQDSFTVSDQVNSYHPYARGLTVRNNKEGNILFIGTGLSKGSLVTDLFGSRKGSFKISVEIYSKNKWGIKPRKLL